MILDSSIYRINHYPADTTIRENNGVIHWIEIYPRWKLRRYSSPFEQLVGAGLTVQN